MIEAIRRAAPILATGVVVMASALAGFWVGERTAHAKTTEVAIPVQLGRFQAVGDREALDTKTGIICTPISGIQIDPQTGERVQNPLPVCAVR